MDQQSWYAPNVDAMYAQGALANLGTTTFAPNQPMDREDVAALKIPAGGTLHFTDLSQIAPADVPAVEAVATWPASRTAASSRSVR
ncbi:MAG: S-layer homology domain-containing protein [Thermaerobacter sp.]|nr:S-layer homology domain-containing protein [Thermaerobacter sp.]